MNWAIFSTLGYVSVALWLCVPLLWLAHELHRPRRWLAHASIVVAIAALVLATINSDSHVARITVDRSKQIEQQRAQQQSARDLAEQQRAGEAAQVAFAEDAAGDRLDKAGLADADRAFFQTLDDGATPDWQKQKQQRTPGAGEAAAGDDLESLIGASADDRTGVETETFVEEKHAEPILMSESDKALADRLDATNLTIIRALLLLGVGYLALDYVRRLNVDRERYFPLPVPSRWADAMTRRSPVDSLADMKGRSVLAELSTIARRGEVFIYLTDDPAAADRAAKPLGRLPAGRWPIRPVRAGDEAQPDDEFIFETLWYGRNAFVIDSPDRAARLLERFVELMTRRRETRAHAKQRVHVVWDLDLPVPEATRHRFEKLADATGFRLLLCRQA